MQGSDERHGIRRGIRTSGGATAVEYLGTLGVVALVTGAVVATNIGGDVAGYAHEHVCRIVEMGRGTDCGGNGSADGRQPDPDEPIKPATAPGEEPGVSGDVPGDVLDDVLGGESDRESDDVAPSAHAAKPSTSPPTFVRSFLSSPGSAPMAHLGPTR